MYTGALVRSISGRDRYRLFIICGVTEDGRALIANGRLHTKSSPKKKNLAHLDIIRTDTGLEKLDDNALYTALKKLEANKNHNAGI